LEIFFSAALSNRAGISGGKYVFSISNPYLSSGTDAIFIFSQLSVKNPAETACGLAQTANKIIFFQIPFGILFRKIKSPQINVQENSIDGELSPANVRDC
jgi:hypothetical protein